MATIKTDLIGKLEATSPKARPLGYETGASLLRLTATYTATGDEAAGDVIEIGELPIGAELVPNLCTVISEGLGGTTGTITKLGDAEDDDRYSATAIALTAAGIVNVTATNAAALTPYRVTEETKRIAGTIGLASGSFTAGKKVRFQLVYVMSGR
ncbi:MAG TPA: hypothetical protein VNQ90_17710 [Chthoniobacteraceae bacterium]|nr:hypothetical protein [Chthoniobacteraceae bacterium]